MPNFHDLTRLIDRQTAKHIRAVKKIQILQSFIETSYRADGGSFTARDYQGLLNLLAQVDGRAAD
jgi:hypothetical protein